MLISKGNFGQDSLKGEVVVVTGAGRGIGFEAARALVWLGAKVVIAEINEKNGKAAQEVINEEFGEGKAVFVKTDIGEPEDIEHLAEMAQKKFGKIDAVLNNATVFPMGAIKDVPIDSWDFSYRVNLRGPVLLGKKVPTRNASAQAWRIRLRLLFRCSPVYGSIRSFQDSPSRISQHPLR